MDSPVPENLAPERFLAKGQQSYAWKPLRTTTGTDMVLLRLWTPVGLTSLLWMPDYVRKMCQDGMAAAGGIVLASEYPKANGNGAGG